PRVTYGSGCFECVARFARFGRYPKPEFGASSTFINQTDCAGEFVVQTYRPHPVFTGLPPGLCESNEPGSIIPTIRGRNRRPLLNVRILARPVDLFDVVRRRWRKRQTASV